VLKCFPVRPVVSRHKSAAKPYALSVRNLGRSTQYPFEGAKAHHCAVEYLTPVASQTVRALMMIPVNRYCPAQRDSSTQPALARCLRYLGRLIDRGKDCAGVKQRKPLYHVRKRASQALAGHTRQGPLTSIVEAVLLMRGSIAVRELRFFSQCWPVPYVSGVPQASCCDLCLNLYY
jgi:hypothetical protein